MTDVQRSLEYPRNDDDWLRTLLIGGVLLFFSFLFVPVLFVYGYLVRVIRNRLDEEHVPPVFDEWAQLGTDGIQVLVIGFIYMLIPIAVAAVTVGGAITSLAFDSSGGLAVAQLFVGFLLSGLLALVFGYVAIPAIVNFARVGTLQAGFAVDDIKPVLVSTEYAIDWLLAVGVLLVAGVLTAVLNAVPLVGAVLGAFVTFYALVVATHIWAGGFAKAHRSGDTRSHSNVGKSTV